MGKLRALGVGFALVVASGAASAESVYVKSRGHVDLESFRCESYGSSSPNVRRICYDEARQYVLVSLSGVWYHYCGVPALTVTEWKRAPSKGRYYNDHIRSGFDCTPPEATLPAAPAPEQSAAAR
jgi:hypothetical protein